MMYSGKKINSFTDLNAWKQRQFYHIAKGSLTELQNQLIIARDVGYIDLDAFNTLAEQTITVSRLLTGLIKSTRRMDT